MDAGLGRAGPDHAFLLVLLATRVRGSPTLIAYSILMILLLNSRSVRAVVQPRRAVPVGSRSEVAHGE